MSFYHLTVMNEVCVELHAVYNEIFLVAEALKLISASQDSPVSFNPGYYQGCASLLNVLDSLLARARHLNTRNLSESLEEPCVPFTTMDDVYAPIPEDKEVNELPPCFGDDVYDKLYFQCPPDPVFPCDQLNPQAKPFVPDANANAFVPDANANAFVPDVLPISSWHQASAVPSTGLKPDLRKLYTHGNKPLDFKPFITKEDLERCGARYDMLHPTQQTEYPLECYASHTPAVYKNERNL